MVNKQIDNYVYSLRFGKFLLLGDSITQRAFNPQPLTDFIDSGYGDESDVNVVQEFNLGCQLQADYTRRLDVLNRGFTGYNSDHYRVMIDKILEIEHDRSYSKVRLVTLFLGSNDAAHAPPDQVPYDRFIENMKYIMDQLIKRDIKVVLLGPAHYHKHLWERYNPGDVRNGITRDDETNLKYSEGIRGIAAEFHVPFVDLFSKFDEAGNPIDMSQDGIHYNGEGYKVVYEGVKDAIKQWYPELVPANMPTVLPDWETIDLTRVTI